ncbi:MAG TPA: UDP-N-acetylmuramate--L-alanine ligase [Pirellulales bacterium]|nr:UDP-N-acetylmuramate--L-alanine ligase [Pirellulales bacterium]
MIRLAATADRASGSPAGIAHLVGICGSGMQSLAGVLLDRGWHLTGSDVDPARALWLRSRGVHVSAGHAAGHLSPHAGMLIYSDAVGADNPERRQATARRIPQFSYPAMLGQLMAGRQGLAVTGTHGKSTVTAMASGILLAAGLDPTVVVGAVPRGREHGGRHGDGALVLVEACEYRANFLHLLPQTAVVLGIEADHFDYFRTLADVEAAFRRFLSQLPSGALAIVNQDCPATRRAIAGLDLNLQTLGCTASADWQATDVRAQVGRYRFAVRHRRRLVAEVKLSVAGGHQVGNALAAAALAHAAGAADEAIAEGLRQFRGLKRRLEVLGSWQGITLVDDYAHHPTEVRAALAAVRELYPGRRLWCIFEPHQASRTRHLLDEFAASLQNADVVAVADIVRAREGPPLAGEVQAADLAERVDGATGSQGAPSVIGCHTRGELLEHLSAQAAAGDVVLTLGAGDIRNVCHGLASRLRRPCAA